MIEALFNFNTHSTMRLEKWLKNSLEYKINFKIIIKN
jgi:hypothetical protein